MILQFSQLNGSELLIILAITVYHYVIFKLIWKQSKTKWWFYQASSSREMLLNNNLKRNENNYIHISDWKKPHLPFWAFTPPTTRLIPTLDVPQPSCGVSKRPIIVCSPYGCCAGNFFRLVKIIFQLYVKLLFCIMLNIDWMNLLNPSTDAEKYLESSLISYPVWIVSKIRLYITYRWFVLLQQQIGLLKLDVSLSFWKPNGFFANCVMIECSVLAYILNFCLTPQGRIISFHNCCQ